MDDIQKVISSYSGLEGGKVDGGGQKLVASSESSLKYEFYSSGKGNLAKFLNGGKPFTDDVVFEIGEGSVGIYSSSRVGDSDFGVNGKRVGEIARGLRGLGWS